MKRYLSVFAVVAVVGACWSAAVDAHPLTTTPDVVHEVSVKLTNTAINIPKDQYVQANGITRYLRGSVVDFTFKNTGTKPITVQLTTQAKNEQFHRRQVRRRRDCREADPAWLCPALDTALLLSRNLCDADGHRR